MHAKNPCRVYTLLRSVLSGHRPEQGVDMRRSEAEVVVEWLELGDGADVEAW